MDNPAAVLPDGSSWLVLYRFLYALIMIVIALGALGFCGCRLLD